MDDDKAEKLNKLLWDELAKVHERSYDIKFLKDRISLINDIQKRELYPIKGKKVLHLQCNIGTDSISLALDGARVTAVDYSKKSIEIANKLNLEIGTGVKFICSNIFALKKKLKEKFDIVYTSEGVLSWIRDVKKWAGIISHFLKGNGIFYIIEIHPLKNIFDYRLKNELKIKYSYFHQKEPTVFDDDSPDYSDSTYIPSNHSYEWTWSLSDVVNALIESGLKIEFLNEYDKLFYNGHPGMVKDKDGWWYLEKYKGKIPYTFSIKARKV
jgi:2-polyprenyl-3-methyl-5-hydroxy-6-metoxy-1,4-benzoquinol methylase